MTTSQNYKKDLRSEALRAYYDSDQNVSAAAASLGIPRSTYRHRLRKALVDSASNPLSSVEMVDLPAFVDSDLDAEEILDHMQRRFEQRLKHEESLNWFKVNINDTDPMGLVVVGDPHLGSNGCNVQLLRSDIDVMCNTPGLYAVNIGDTADNWAYGNLVRLYAENDVSRQTERRLARWFLQDAGIPWIVWLMGNHDTMAGEFSTYLKTINADYLPMVDWRAKFSLTFPNEIEIKIDAAHNHKGTSIYNPLHGQKRAALWNENADIYVAGHHHNWATNQEELDDGRVVTMARARGYKYLDEYAVHHGFYNRQHGASIMFVIDPLSEDPTERIQPFANLKRGAEYLTFRRSHA